MTPSPPGCRCEALPSSALFRDSAPDAQWKRLDVIALALLTASVFTALLP